MNKKKETHDEQAAAAEKAAVLEYLAVLTGKVVYLALRRLDEDGVVLTEDSHFGTITEASETGIVITFADGNTQKLPPAPQAFQPCPPDIVPVPTAKPTPTSFRCGNQNQPKTNPSAPNGPG